jgi:hypothetical protein
MIIENKYKPDIGIWFNWPNFELQIALLIRSKYLTGFL